MIQKRPLAAHETDNWIFTAVPGKVVYLGPKMFSDIRTERELGHPSATPNGVRDTQVVLLPCRLDHFVKGLGYDSPSGPSISVRATE